jgi:hypothetical protein
MHVKLQVVTYLHQCPEHPLPDVCCHRRLQVTPLLSAQTMGLEGLRVGRAAKG